MWQNGIVFITPFDRSNKFNMQRKNNLVGWVWFSSIVVNRTNGGYKSQLVKVKLDVDRISNAAFILRNIFRTCAMNFIVHIIFWLLVGLYSVEKGIEYNKVVRMPFIPRLNWPYFIKNWYTPSPNPTIK